MRDAKILALVGPRQGVVSRRELRTAGMSDSSIRRAVARGTWEPVGRSALVVPGTARTLAVRTRILAINHPAMVPTGISAVALNPRSPFAGFVDNVAIPWLIGPKDPANRWFAVAHPRAATTTRTGLVVASELVAVVDMMRFLPPARAADVAMTAIQKKRTTLARLRTYANGLVGCAGIHQLRDLILALSDGAHSHAERRIVAALKAHGITGWVVNGTFLIGGEELELDIAFPRQQVVVEFDGWAYHSDPEAFRRDRERQNLLVNNGWLVLRYTWTHLSDIGAVMAQIRAALASRAAA